MEFVRALSIVVTIEQLEAHYVPPVRRLKEWGGKYFVTHKDSKTLLNCIETGM